MKTKTYLSMVAGLSLALTQLSSAQAYNIPKYLSSNAIKDEISLFENHPELPEPFPLLRTPITKAKPLDLRIVSPEAFEEIKNISHQRPESKIGAALFPKK